MAGVGVVGSGVADEVQVWDRGDAEGCFLKRGVRLESLFVTWMRKMEGREWGGGGITIVVCWGGAQVLSVLETEVDGGVAVGADEDHSRTAPLQRLHHAEARVADGHVQRRGLFLRRSFEGEGGVV